MEHGAHDSQVAHYNDKIFFFCVLIVGYLQKKANKKLFMETKTAFCYTVTILSLLKMY